MKIWRKYVQKKNSHLLCLSWQHNYFNRVDSNLLDRFHHEYPRDIDDKEVDWDRWYSYFLVIHNMYLYIFFLFLVIYWNIDILIFFKSIYFSFYFVEIYMWFFCFCYFHFWTIFRNLFFNLIEFLNIFWLLLFFNYFRFYF